jgi:RNA polymerase sigma factor (sigma-70 family)
VQTDPELEALLRRLAPQALGAVVRRYGHFDLAEDAVQEALLAAAGTWSERGIPGQPRGWLITVAARRLTDRLRGEQARRRRELAVAENEPMIMPGPDQADPDPGADDTLTLLFMCCHPALTEATQVALTLRAVGGLTTAEIGHTFLVAEATVAQRISRAKQRIAESGVRFERPTEGDEEARLNAVLQVLYLIFTEGHTASSGEELRRVELTAEAIRLTRIVRDQRRDHGEVAGLLALLLLTEARGPARIAADGSLVPLAEQDRSRWRTDQLQEGIAVITGALAAAPTGPYQLQAAIAALHAEAAEAADTDWPQIVGLYRLLDQLSDNPMITLNRVVAEAMASGGETGLELLDRFELDHRLAGHHRVPAVRAQLLELAGRLEDAEADYRLAAQRAKSLPERRYLEGRADVIRSRGRRSAAARTDP